MVQHCQVAPNDRWDLQSAMMERMSAGTQAGGQSAEVPVRDPDAGPPPAAT